MENPKRIRSWFLHGSLAALFWLLGGNLLHSQLVNTPYGWFSYLSHQNVREISHLGNQIYAITEGGMFRVDPETRRTHLFNPITRLSSVTPTTLYRDPGSESIFVGFNDGMVNRIFADDAVKYITDIERTNLFTTKRINRFLSQDSLLYIATEFGIVVYDVNRDETRLSVTKIAENASGIPVQDIAIADGRLWASLGSLGLYSVDLSSPNITVPAAWSRASGFDGLPPGNIPFVCSVEDRVFVLLADTIFERGSNGLWSYAPFPFDDYVYLNSTEGQVHAAAGSLVYVLRSDNSLQMENNLGTVNASYVTGDRIWAGDIRAGLMYFLEDGGRRYVQPAGPINNFVTDLAAGQGGLYIAPRGKKGSSDRWYDKSGIPYFNLSSGGWKINSHVTGELDEDSVYQDFARAYFDDRTGYCYMGSFAEGIVVMKDGNPVRQYSAANSGLLATGDRNRVSGLAMDDYGNLWVTQIINDWPIHVLTAEGEWFRTKPMDMDPIGIMIDNYDTKWIINQGKGLVAYHDNYTPGDISDDRVKELNTEFGKGQLLDNSVYSIAQDLDEQIWVGTESGVTIFYDPSILWTNDFQDAACPIIDGFCLLRDQRVNDIAVDAANRKWLATQNGVYLVNEDGTELLIHFTTDNSPLFDNDVKAVTIDQSTGEVFFGTALGTIGYVGDAILGSDTLVSKLYAFPNPVYQDFGGKVTIKNMDQESEVKIVSASGQLVRELSSNGGQVPWDMRDTYGNLVPPGIYVVMVSTATGESAGVTKLAILERQF